MSVNADPKSSTKGIGGVPRDRQKKGPRPLFNPIFKGTGTFFSLAFFLIALLRPAQDAEAAVWLPLDGYYRPGRFFPVAVDGGDAHRELIFSGQGLLDCRLDAGDASSRAVPVLPTGAAAELKWAGGSLPLRPLRSHERLVASDLSDVDPGLFPDAKIIRIALNSGDLLPGPPVAWETLDGLLLPSSEYQRITDAQRSALLAGGVLLASRGERPDLRWPWRQQGSLWVLSIVPAGPQDGLVDESVYSPTYAWVPGWPARARLELMGVATLLLLVTMGILLIRRNRVGALAAIALSVLAAGVIAYRRQNEGSVDRGGGDIFVAGPGLVQRDSWVYQRGRRDSTVVVPWAGSTHPIFASDAEMTRADLQIHISGSDQLQFIYQSQAMHTLAFVRREMLLGGTPAVTATHLAAMSEAAKAAYLGPGMKVIGETKASDGRWAGVVISRDPPQ